MKHESKIIVTDTKIMSAMKDLAIACGAYEFAAECRNIEKFYKEVDDISESEKKKQ